MDLSLLFFADADTGGDRYRLMLESVRFADTRGFRAVSTRNATSTRSAASTRTRR